MTDTAYKSKVQLKYATITVRFKNPPRPAAEGKKPGPGSVKDTNNNPWKVWGDDLQKFVEGGTYRIGYEAGTYNDKPDNVVREVGPAVMSNVSEEFNDDIPFGKPPLANTAGIVKQALTNHPVPPQGGADIGGVPYSPLAKHVPDKDEHIHVSMVMKEAIRGGHCDPNSAADLVRVGRTARAAYPAIWKDGE